jgi:hypothetical protein
LTHTVQHRSLALSSKAGKELIGDKGETEGSIGCLLSLCDSLNNLSKALNRLDNVQNKLCKKLITLERIVHNI